MNVRVGVLTGHVFGVRAATGLIKSNAYAENRISIAALISIDQPPAIATVGTASLLNLAEQIAAPHLASDTVKSPRVAQFLEAAELDYLLAIGLSELLPEELLRKAISRGRASELLHSSSHGCIGMHPSLLPQGRGRAPIPWTIILGLRQTGLTTFFLDAEADAGPIIDQREIEVHSTETAATLFLRMADLHELAARELSQNVAISHVHSHAQDDSQATWWKRRHPDDSELNFDAPAMVVERLIRASTHPYPGAYFWHNNNRYYVNSAHIEKSSTNEAPGTVVSVDTAGRPTIVAKDGSVSITQFRQSPAARLQVGDRIRRQEANP